MITRKPDIARLLDRLEKRALIARLRETKDQRMVTVRLTQTGLDLLDGLDEPLQVVHRERLGHLGEKRLKQVSELLTACRDRPALRRFHLIFARTEVVVSKHIRVMELAVMMPL